MSPTASRSSERTPWSAGSAFRTPLARSSSVVGFTTFFSFTFELMKSTVELYWSTKAWILDLTTSVLGPGLPTTTEAALAMTPLKVRVTPGIALVTTFDADDCSRPPSTVYFASRAASDSANPSAVSRPESAVTAIVFASPVTLPDSTSFPLTTDA
jgi:hypothetical protein